MLFAVSPYDLRVIVLQFRSAAVLPLQQHDNTATPQHGLYFDRSTPFDPSLCTLQFAL